MKYMKKSHPRKLLLFVLFYVKQIKVNFATVFHKTLRDKKFLFVSDTY